LPKDASQQAGHNSVQGGPGYKRLHVGRSHQPLPDGCVHIGTGISTSHPHRLGHRQRLTAFSTHFPRFQNTGSEIDLDRLYSGDNKENVVKMAQTLYAALDTGHPSTLTPREIPAATSHLLLRPPIQIHSYRRSAGPKALEGGLGLFRRRRGAHQAGLCNDPANDRGHRHGGIGRPSQVKIVVLQAAAARSPPGRTV
jgi:hypothetical protein